MGEGRFPRGRGTRKSSPAFNFRGKSARTSSVPLDEISIATFPTSDSPFPFILPSASFLHRSSLFSFDESPFQRRNLFEEGLSQS